MILDELHMYATSISDRLRPLSAVNRYNNSPEVPRVIWPSPNRPATFLRSAHHSLQTRSQSRELHNGAPAVLPTQNSLASQGDGEGRLSTGARFRRTHIAWHSYLK